MRYVIVMIVLLSHLFSAQDIEKVKLQLHWYHQFQFAGYYMAKEKGYYKEAGLDVEIKEVDFSTNIVGDVTRQKSQYATGNTSLIADRTAGHKIVLLAAILQDSPIVIVTKESSNIQTIKDFSGKHIDASGTMMDSLSMHALLNEKDITVDPPEHVHLYTDIKDSLMSNHADGILLYNTDETYQLEKMGIKYKLFYPRDFGFNSYSDFLFSSEDEVKKHPKRVTAFKKASLKGWEYAFSHIDETIHLILDKYNTQNKTYDELSYQAHELKKLAYYKTEKLGEINAEKISKIYDTYKKLGFIKNDLNLDSFILQEDQSINDLFNTKEKNYLQEKKELLLCGQTKWKPYLDFTGNKPEGIMADMAKEYEKIIGIPLTFIHTDNWAACIALTQQKEIDIAVPILTKPNHHQDLIPTKPIAKDNLVLVSKVEKPFITDITEVGKLKVSLCRGNDSYLHYVKSKYPNLELVFVNDLQEGLKSVAQDKVDAYLGTLLPVSFEISRAYSKILKITARFTEVDITGSIGVHQNEPILLDILNKTIEVMDPKITKDIFNSWISVKQIKVLDNTLLWQMFIGSIVIFLILYFRQKILKVEHLKLQAAYDQINEQKNKLKEQKSFNDLVYNSITNGILMLENGRFTDCNQAILKILNYTKKEELLNLMPTDISPQYQPDGRLSSEKSEEMIALALKNGVHTFEWTHTTANGKDIWAEITLTRIFDDHKQILHVVWRDISKRKKLEHANASMKEQMELAFSGSRDGLWDWNITDNTVYFSRRWKEMLGYTDDELENKFSNWKDRVHPDDLEQTLKDIQLNLDGKTDVYENKHRLRHKDGHWVWVLDRGKTQFDDIGNAIRMIGTHTDLTTEINLTNKLSELNHTLEQKIEEAISGLKKAQQQAKLGSWKLDIVQNTLVWSDETYDIFELPHSSNMATYENFLNGIHPDDRDKVNDAYMNSLETQEPYEIIHRLRMDDGRIKYVKEHCETTFDSEGKALISVGTIQDITTEQTAIQQLRHNDEIMFRQSRLAQMGEMISMIAHQWRQPLNAVSLTAAKLEQKAENDQYDKVFFTNRLQRIINYVQHLSLTIEDFRNFFKPEKGKQEITFSKVIKNTLSLISIELENNNIRVETQFNTKSKMLSYPNELLQVILNLIKNAEDALLEHKVINPVIKMKCYSDDDHAIFEIADNAGGIDESIMDKIFNPYFTTKDKRNGTGLGLYMSKIIIEEHCDGILSVSNSDEGAVFKIVFKLS